MASTVITPPKLEPRSRTDDFGRGGSGSDDPRFGGGHGRSDGWAIPDRTYRTGMWVGLSAIVMLFAAFTSALVVRQGVSNDWVHTALPPILYFNTAVLLASSLTLELARRSLARGLGNSFRYWLDATLLLGLAFIAGQLMGWGELAARGVYLSTNPSSSFFYLLSAAHGAHLLGGIIALFYLVFRADRIAQGLERAIQMELTATYWHFMDGLWSYILVLLIGR